MKIITCEQIRKVDEYTIENEPISSVDLMERASDSCFQWIKEKLGNFLSVKLFIGPGNNGGDGLALARMLATEENTVSVYMLTDPEKLSPDALINFKCLKRYNIDVFFLQENVLPELIETDIIIDALFGSGLSRSIEGLAAKVIKHINQSSSIIIAIDVPSGLFGENNKLNRSEAITEATYTLTFQFSKLAFLFAENEKNVGELVILDIGLAIEAIDMQESSYYLMEDFEIASLLIKRNKFSHKGTYGHALLFSGSYGKMGAALLASQACLRSGAGLLTTHMPAIGNSILQTAFPEAMVSIDALDDKISNIPVLDNYSAIGIGPGIGKSEETTEALHQLLLMVKVPLILDADALNILALNPDWIQLLPPETILTPHPGEFDRLVGFSENSFERHLKQISFSQKTKTIVVLKGAYSSISTPEGMCFFNSTGNPGMATAGSGDVLTGIILSLLTQKYNPLNAALIGVFIHGLAGDLALENSSEEGIIASDIINNLGKAFKTIKSLL